MLRLGFYPAASEPGRSPGSMHICSPFWLVLIDPAWSALCIPPHPQQTKSLQWLDLVPLYCLQHGDETTTLDNDDGTRFLPSTATIIMCLQHDNSSSRHINKDQEMCPRTHLRVPKKSRSTLGTISVHTLAARGLEEHIMQVPLILAIIISFMLSVHWLPYDSWIQLK